MDEARKREIERDQVVALRVDRFQLKDSAFESVDSAVSFIEAAVHLIGGNVINQHEWPTPQGIVIERMNDGEGRYHRTDLTREFQRGPEALQQYVEVLCTKIVKGAVGYLYILPIDIDTMGRRFQLHAEYCPVDGDPEEVGRILLGFEQDEDGGLKAHMADEGDFEIPRPGGVWVPRCPECQGLGEVIPSVFAGPNMSEPEPVECWTCGGTGRQKPADRVKE